MLQEIQRRVQEQLQKRHKEVVISAYKALVNKHGREVCQCDYCIKTRRYTSLKILLHRELVREDYNWGDYTRNSRIWDLKLDIKKLKTERKELKQL